MREAAKNCQVRLIIDQLDALCSLVDVSSRRLHVLLRLIYSVAGQENVAIVYSCREFEHEYDARFSALKAEEVKLALPSWELVSPVISQRGLDPATLNPEMREMLRTPQHLKVFLDLSRDGEFSLIATYQAMLEALWRTKLDGQPASAKRALLAEIADALIAQEDQWVAIAIWASHRDLLNELVSDGFLTFTHDKLRIGFAHQTIGDFARVRVFLENGQSIAKYTLDRTNKLFVRPIVWSALQYLRQASPKGYTHELSLLWNSDQLSKHLRLLIIELVGSQTSPIQAEIRLLSPVLDTDEARTMLFAVRRSEGWFKHIAESRLRTWMQSHEGRDYSIILLSAGIKHSQESAILFIETYWKNRSDYANAVSSILAQIENWSDRSIDFAIRHIDTTGEHNFEIMIAFQNALKSKGATAFGILRAYLDAQLSNALSQPGANLAIDEYPSQSHPVIQSVEKDNVWHFLDRKVEAMPIPFLAVALNWLQRAIDTVRIPHIEGAYSYQLDGLSHWPFDDDDSDDSPQHADPRRLAFTIAAKAAATSFPDAFLELANAHSSSEQMGIHSILAIGLKEISPNNPAAVVSYLLSDPRRFYIGTEATPMSYSVELFSALSKAMSAEQVYAVECALMEWRGPYKAEARKDADSRRYKKRLNDLARLKLLQILPRDKLTPSTLRFIDEEARRLPEPEYALPSYGIRGGFVQSPVPKEKLLVASVSDILNLLSELPDGTAHQSKRKFLAGGNRELCRVIGELAKENPRKALAIVDRVAAENQQNLVAHIFDAICQAPEKPHQTKLDDDELIRIFLHWTERGFGRIGFREYFCWGLEKISHRNKGLPDSVCAILRDWLETEPTQSDQTESEEIDKSWDQRSPAIFGARGGGGVLPHGTFPIASALIGGYLQRNPQAANLAAEVLFSRENKSDGDKFWKFHLYYLAPLLAGFPKDGARLVLHLAKQRRHLVTMPEFIGAAWRILDSAPEKDFLSLLDALQATPLLRIRQIIGEIVLARSIAHPEDQCVSAYLDTLLNLDADTPERIGIAHCAASGWSTPSDREYLSDILLNAVQSDSEILIEIGLGALRRKSNPRDLFTLKLLKAAIDSIPRSPTSGISKVLDALPDLFLEFPDEVLRYIEEALPRIRREIADQHTHFAFHGEELVQVAISAHRTPGFEARGLRIFETLLECNVYKSQQVITEIDRWRPV